MNSRGFSIFITRDEWIEALHRVHNKLEIKGVIHYWPDHAYEFLEMSRLSDQLALENPSDMMIRSIELDQTRTARSWFEDHPTVDGMVHLDIPKLWPPDRLLQTYMAIRPCDTQERIPSPVPLFDEIKKEFRRLRRKPLFRSDNGEEYKFSGYTIGALKLYDEGVQFSCGPRDTLTFVPAERWPEFDLSELRIGK